VWGSKLLAAAGEKISRRLKLQKGGEGERGDGGRSNLESIGDLRKT